MCKSIQQIRIHGAKEEDSWERLQNKEYSLQNQHRNQQGVGGANAME